MNVGILGGGQLARMLALAGYPLGLNFRILDPAADACAGQVAPLMTAPFDDPEACEALDDWADVITFDFENVPDAVLTQFKTPIYPSPMAFTVAQDRIREKTHCRRLGLPTALFFPVESWSSLLVAVAQTGYPAILKTCRFGYDGKGQRFIRTPNDLYPAWRSLSGAPLILEAFIPFERELSCVAVRGRDGEMAFYPLAENQHRQGILHRSVAPTPHATPALVAAAEQALHKLLKSLHYVGVLAVEFFVHDGQLLVNEMAPRVHNSGHWTIEGAVTSQFENHLRAICGLPLGSTAARGHSAMVNFIGTLPDKALWLGQKGVHFHDYGKAARAGRKVGHATFVGDTPQAVDDWLAQRLP